MEWLVADQLSEYRMLFNPDQEMAWLDHIDKRYKLLLLLFQLIQMYYFNPQLYMIDPAAKNLFVYSRAPVKKAFHV